MITVNSAFNSGWKKLTLIKLQKTWRYSDRIAGTITIAWILFSLWGVCYALSKWSIPMDGTLFAILLLLMTTMAGGLLMKIIRLPPLLGMLLIGFIWRNWNTTNVDVAGQISTTWSVLFRYIHLNKMSNLKPVNIFSLVTGIWLQ